MRRESQKLLSHPLTDPQTSISNNKLGTLVSAVIISVGSKIE